MMPMLALIAILEAMKSGSQSHQNCACQFSRADLKLPVSNTFIATGTSVCGTILALCCPVP
jgi:hypothetical protein